jgi:site-specific recombinase XerD
MKRSKNKLPRGVFVRDGVYWIRFSDQHGKIHRQHIGPFLESAKAAVERRRDQVRSGQFFPELVRQRSLVFGELANDYLRHAKLKKRSWRDSEDHVQALLTRLKDAPVAELTAGRLEAVLDELSEERGWSPATFNRYRSTLSAIFKHARKHAKVETNPARDITHMKENNSRVRYLTADEEERLIAVLRERWPEREAEILVALHSGMRRSEQYKTFEVPDGGLKWEHVNLKAGVLRLPRSKSGKARAIQINSVLNQTFAAIVRTTSAYVFTSTDPNGWLRDACQAAQVANFHWHDFRHTFASRLVMKGVPLRAVAELLGHSEITTTQRYAHLAPGYLADAVECLVEPESTQKSTAMRTKGTGTFGRQS